MNQQTRTSFLTLLGLALAALPAAAGKVSPAEPVTVQAATPPLLQDPDYLVLPGNVLPVLASARQLGPADAQAPMDNMILALKLTPEAEARLEQRLADLQDSGSPAFHQWLTPQQFGAEFGPDPETLERVTGWLQESGFQVGEVAAGRMSITFSGTVEQVEQAFQTPIRRFLVDGKPRQGNTGDPAIPRALADVVAGVVSLHNVPHPAMNRGFSTAALGQGQNLTPGDFAEIYNLGSLYQQGTDGSGVSIAIVGRTHFPLSDIAAFRSAFGLPAQVPEVIINGTDPGDLGMDEDGEADLDVEWAGAVARKAAIRFVASKSTDATDGVDLSARYVVDHNLAPIMSTSFGQCESQMGDTERTFFRDLWAQAAAQGISSLVASGDSGPAGCDSGDADSGTGAAVSGLASTPFNMAVGGTQFDPSAFAASSGKPRADQSTATGYIREKAWNESGSTGGYGLWAGGGGLSGFHPRPSWQVALGVPGDAKYRCIPDASLAAAGQNGYAIQTSGGRASVGGTSCSSPAMAGIMALVVQVTGQRQGNPCPTFYALGNAQYQGTGPTVFHDIIAGNTDVPGTKGYACTPGYDLATGLGSVDAQALVDAWISGQGIDIEASIGKPATDLVIDSGTAVSFQGAAHTSHPGSTLTYAWNFGDGTSGSGASASHVFNNPGPAPVVRVVTFTASDSNGVQGSDTRAITVQPGPPPGELIVNGGFEAGSKAWTARNVSIGNNIIAEPARTGAGDAWFSGWQNGLPEVLRQTVVIPAKAAAATLTFWLHIDTFGTLGEPVDCLQVKARGAGGVLATLASFSNLDNAPGYQLHTIDLGAYRGQKVELSFVAVHSPWGVSTSFALDDVSLIAK